MDKSLCFTCFERETGNDATCTLIPLDRLDSLEVDSRRWKDHQEFVHEIKKDLSEIAIKIQEILGRLDVATEDLPF